MDNFRFPHLVRSRSARHYLLIGMAFLFWWAPAEAVRCEGQAGVIQFVESYLWSTPQGVVIDADIAYVSFFNGIKVYDISDPSSPNEVAQFDLKMNGSVTLDSQNHLLYNTYAPMTGGNGQLHVVDVSDPADPHLLATVEVPFVPGGIAVADSLIYVAFQADSAWAGENGLGVIDVSDPGSPKLVGSILVSMLPFGVTVDGDRAYLYGTALTTIDVSDPESLSVVHEFKPHYSFEVWSAIARDSVLFVSDASVLQPSSSALRVYSVADPLSPIEIGKLDFFGSDPRHAHGWRYCFLVKRRQGVRGRCVRSHSTGHDFKFCDRGLGESNCLC